MLSPTCIQNLLYCNLAWFVKCYNGTLNLFSRINGWIWFSLWWTVCVLCKLARHLCMFQQSVNSSSSANWLEVLCMSPKSVNMCVYFFKLFSYCIFICSITFLNILLYEELVIFHHLYHFFYIFDRTLPNMC